MTPNMNLWNPRNRHLSLIKRWLHSLWLSILLLILLQFGLRQNAFANNAIRENMALPQSPTIQQATPDAMLPAALFTETMPLADGKPGLSEGTVLTAPVRLIEQTDRSALSSPAQVDGAGPTVIIWSGLNQSFGQLGNPQPWVNILGNASTSSGSITSLVYSLNGGPARTLSMGPDSRRLAEKGDFNVEMAITDLNDGANTVVITATDNSNASTVTTVTVNYTSGNTWPLPYTADWSTAASIPAVAQIVDGQWVKENGTVRPTWLDYDRLVGIGDLSWTDYEVVVPVTIHGVDEGGFPFPSSGPGVGILMRWDGHFQQASEQPRSGWQRLGALGWFRWSKLANGDVLSGLQLLGYYAGREIDTDPTVVPAVDTPYLFKMSVQSALDGDIYRFKAWEVGDPEPTAWNMQAQGDPTGPSAGSVLLVAHHVDATFGNVTVQPLSAIRPRVTTSTNGNGQIQIDPMQSDYAYGQIITLTSVPDNGSMLSGWSGDLGGQANPVVLEITKDLDVTANFTAATAPFSDDFNRCELGTAFWSWIDPRGDATLQLNGQQAVISVPAGQSHDVWTGGNFAPRLMQSATNSNLDLVAKFEAQLNAQFQLQGMIVEQDANNYLRFDFYHDGNMLRMHAASVSGGTATTRVNKTIAAPSPLYLRVVRNGDQWTQYYATDGVNWLNGTSFSHALTVNRVGPFAGNAGNNAPAFTTAVDYFFNSAAPIIPEDSTAVGPTIQVVGNGSVSRQPEQTNYGCGQVVTLTATPAEGWSFAGWSGAVSGTQNPTTLNAATGQVATATFTESRYSLSTDWVGEGAVGIDPELENYPHNTVVTVTATPADGWSFAGWEGDLAGTTNPAQLTMNQTKSVTAIFTTNTSTVTHQLTTNVTGNGTVTRSPDKTTYVDGEQVTLTAVPDSGWRFAGWQGVAGTANPSTVVMTTDRVITATFEPIQYSVDVVVVGNGTVSRSPEQEEYPQDSALTLTAIPAAGWLFAGWQGDASGSQSPLELTVDSSKQITATFVEEQTTTFSLLASGSTGGTVEISPVMTTYPAGTAVTVRAVPIAGWRFDRWEGDVTSTDNPLQLIMSRNYAVQARFVPTTATFTATAEGGGQIEASLPPGTYPIGTEITLTANPAPDNVFLGWGGDATGTEPTITLLLDGDKNVIARFGVAQHALTMTTTGDGTITTDADAPYQHNQTVQLTATAKSGWRFNGWGGDLQGTQNPITIVMNGDKTVTATFVEDVVGTNERRIYLPLVSR